MAAWLSWIRQMRMNATGCAWFARLSAQKHRTVWPTSWEPIFSTTQPDRFPREKSCRCGMHHILPRNWENPASQTQLHKVGFSPDITVITYIMRQSACLVLNPITVYSYGFLFNCTTVGQASDSMTALT